MMAYLGSQMNDWKDQWGLCHLAWLEFQLSVSLAPNNCLHSHFSHEATESSLSHKVCLVQVQLSLYLGNHSEPLQVFVTCSGSSLFFRTWAHNSNYRIVMNFEAYFLSPLRATCSAWTLSLCAMERRLPSDRSQGKCGASSCISLLK